MKPLRFVFILGGISLVASFGFILYQLFLGPDRIELAGRSLPELWDSGDLLPVLIVPGALIISAAAFLPFMRIMFPAGIKNGVTARAKVLKVWDTGVSINDNPQVGMLLEVSPAGGNPFQAEAKTVVSRLNAGLVQPGITAEVKYDPQNPKRMQILTVHVEGPASGDSAARLEELNGLHDKNLITEEEYRRKREDILKAL